MLDSDYNFADYIINCLCIYFLFQLYRRRFIIPASINGRPFGVYHAPKFREEQKRAMKSNEKSF